MSSTTSHFRRPTYRAPSPPTWACYEQIPYGSEDESESCSDSEDERDDDRHDDDEDESDSDDGYVTIAVTSGAPRTDGSVGAADVQNMDIDHEGDAATRVSSADHVGADGSDGDGSDGGVEAVLKKDVKGKQRAVEPMDANANTDDDLHGDSVAPSPPSPSVSKQSPKRERRRARRPVYNPRPILTIHKSQGFVWNQDLFVPPYIKDRCTYPLLFPLTPRS
jgi:hypothetical protein